MIFYEYMYKSSSGKFAFVRARPRPRRSVEPRRRVAGKKNDWPDDGERRRVADGLFFAYFLAVTLFYSRRGINF